MMYTEKIRAILQKQKKNKPTLIQKGTYQPIKTGASVVALAKTGTGKTLAYALPALERLKQGSAHGLVIFAPTTELAVQIEKVIRPFVLVLGLKELALVGGGNRKRQLQKLRRRQPEVIVTTPGRFFDFFQKKQIKIDEIQTLIIDEADDLLEFSKLAMLKALGQNLAAKAQILLFGATSSSLTLKADQLFNRPFLLIDVRAEQKSKIEHDFLQVDNRHKIEFLKRLTQLPNFKGIVFFNSNYALERHAKILHHTHLKFDILANVLTKKEQTTNLQDFIKGRHKLLLATDVAAQGLDLPAVTYIINFECPTGRHVYLHRAGRTGRMLAHGFVVTMGDDHDYRDLLHLLGAGISLKRVYFGHKWLTTRLPKKRHQDRNDNFSKVKVTSKHKHQKRHNKNKGYHPHYLKVKK